MTDGFTRKKVSSLTLGEKLRKVRTDVRMTLHDVAKSTQIRERYLEAFEDGRYTDLPAEVYARGFLRSYARHLGLDEESCLRLYDQERHIQENLGAESSSKLILVRPHLPLSPSWVITPKLVMSTAIAIILFGTAAYLYVEFRTFVSIPGLMMSEPRDGSRIDGTTTMVAGTTDRGAKVFVNGESIFVDPSGTFSETVALHPGANSISVRSVNRFEKDTTVTVSVDAVFPDIPQPEPTPVSEPTPSPSPSVQITPNSTPIPTPIKKKSSR